MTERTRLRQIRLFLFVLAAGLFVGTVLELIAVRHYDDPVQLIPFGLCGLGVVGIGLVWIKPSRVMTLAFRVLMVITAGGSLFGIYEHIEGNYEFAHELHRRASTSYLIKATFHGGNPLIAPGMLAIAAAIAYAATYATLETETASEPASRAVSGEYLTRPLRWRSRPSSR